MVITEHDPFRLKGYKRWIKEKLMKKVKTVIVASDAAKKLVVEENLVMESQVTVVRNGIDTEEFALESKQDARAEFRRLHFGNDAYGKIILCVAELHERKGQKYLIEAMKSVLGEFPDMRLVFVGDGPSRAHYEKLASYLGERVIFLGRRKDVAQLMTASDIFVLPSIREAFGLVLLEAAIAGLPVVATNVGGIPEIIENGKSGILVEPKDSEDLALAIKLLLKNPQDTQTLCKNLRIKVDMEFDARLMAQRTADVYDKVLK